MVAVFWPYDGWINIGPVAEEIREPQRNVPLGLGLGVLIVVTLVYCGANIGYHLCLPLDHIRGSETVAADVFAKVLGRYGVPLAAAGVMISMFGALNSNLLAGPRIYFAMARDRLFPRAIGQVHSRFKTPLNAILAQSSWSITQIAIAFAIVKEPARGLQRTHRLCRPRRHDFLCPGRRSRDRAALEDAANRPALQSLVLSDHADPLSGRRGAGRGQQSVPLAGRGRDHCRERIRCPRSRRSWRLACCSMRSSGDWNSQSASRQLDIVEIFRPNFLLFALD